VTVTSDALPYHLADMSERERAAIGKAEELSAEVLAKHAQRHDEEASFPTEGFDALRGEGLTGVTVPERHGGLDLRPPAYSLFLRTLARGCASTAGSFHMHNSAMRFLEILGDEEQHRHYFAEAVAGRLFGSWGAEPATSWAGTIALNTGYEEVDGGYRINGAKYFCSLGEGASYGLLYAVPAASAQQANIDDVEYFVVEVESDGVEIVDDWDPLGLRATVSKPVVLKDCVVPAIARVGGPGGVHRVPTEFYGLGYASFYVGIAEAAYAWAVEYAQTRTTKPLNQPIGTYDRIQRKIGTMALDLHAAVLAVEHAARYMAWEGADRFRTIVETMKAKAIATTSALSVTSLAIEVAGGPGALRGLPAERYYRDARTATLMVPAYDQSLETIAKNELGFAEREIH
jgi:alkylation response protein AidB-like acyl-CoA dehydrogenase